MPKRKFNLFNDNDKEESNKNPSFIINNNNLSTDNSSPENFEITTMSTDKKALRKAKTVGLNAARQGHSRPNEQKLIMRNNYTNEQATAYLEAFDAAVATEDGQALRRARRNALSAACKGLSRPNEQELIMRNNYTKEQATAYLEAFDAAIGTEDEQALRKAKKELHQKAFELAKINEPIDFENENPALLLAFQKEKIKIDNKKLAKIRKAGQALGKSKKNLPCLTMEELKSQRGYNDIEAACYIEGYNWGVANKAEKPPSTKAAKKR